MSAATSGPLSHRPRISLRSSGLQASPAARMRSCFHRHGERSEAVHVSTCRAMDCFAEPVIGRRFAPTRWLAMTRMGRCMTTFIERTPSPLSQIANTSRATRRRTAVEIATCPRQCAVALRSNFCRHAQRMVNPQVNVFTSARRRLQMALKGRVRVLFHKRYVTMPVRSVRYRARRGLYECSTLGDKI